MSYNTRENAITGMFAAIMQVINSENISDPATITEAAQKSKTTGSLLSLQNG